MPVLTVHISSPPESKGYRSPSSSHAAHAPCSYMFPKWPALKISLACCDPQKDNAEICAVRLWLIRNAK